MLRVIMSRRWLTAIAVAAAFAVACLLLGRWQWQRHEDRAARAQRITSHYDAAPTTLQSAMPDRTRPLPRAEEWTPVTVTGQYDAGNLLLIRNRPHEGVYGYEVVVPLGLPDGSALLVDRGWVDNGSSAAARPDVPATPSGDVTVTGWLRVGEPSLGGEQLPAGQLKSINLAEAAQQTGTRLYDAYLILRGERGSASQPIERPAALEKPDTGEGPHLAYAIQWWLAVPVGFVLVFVYARREHRDALAARTPPGPDRPGRQLGVNASPRPVPAPSRPRKKRIWDEEDE